MADLTITITNRLGVYAGEPTNKWGTLVWGTDKWGWESTQWSFSKGIFENFVTSSAITGKNVWHLITEALVIGTLVSREIFYAISSSLSVTSSITIVNVINNGWTLSLGEKTNALDWPVDGFAEVADPSTTWTEITTPSTSWTQL